MKEAYDGPGGNRPQAPPSGEYPSRLTAPPPQGQPPALVYLPQTAAPPARGPQQSETEVRCLESLKGIIKIVEIVFLVTAIGCAGSWNDPQEPNVYHLPSKVHWNEWIFFIVVNSAGLAFALITFLVHVCRVVEHDFQHLWTTVIQTSCIVLAMLLLACSAMLAEEVRTYKKVEQFMKRRHGIHFFTKLEVAVVVGFLSMVAFAVDAIIHCVRKDRS